MSVVRIEDRVCSLDGTWSIVFDQGDVGKLQNWHTQAVLEKHSGSEAITVPSCWEGVRQDYEGVAWYCRRFSVPESWRGKSVRIRFEAANYRAEVFINDTPAGFHEGGYTGFELEVGDLLKFDEENFVSVRIVGPILTNDRRIDGIGKNEMPHWRGAITGGLWQSVRLVASERTYVKDVFVEPNIHLSSAVVHVEIENLLPKAKPLKLIVRLDSADDQSLGIFESREAIELQPGRTSLSVDVSIPDARLWSFDDPFLYCLTIELCRNAGQSIDKSQTRFGMREFTVENNRFSLNGEELFLKAAFYEGLYAHTMACPPSEELIRREIRLAKDGGFNMLRPWRKPQPPMVYDLADELGIFFVGAMPIECMKNWPAISPQMEARIATEVRESIRRDRNHASIVCWELFNEIMRPELARLKHRMSMLARSLDDSRMILDESGGFSSRAQVYLPRSREATPFNDVHSYPGGPVNDSVLDAYLALSRTDEERQELGLTRARLTGSKFEPGVLTYISEIGYGSPPDLVDNVSRYRREGNPLTPDYRYTRNLLASFERTIADSPFSGIYPDISAFIDEQQDIHATANKRMVEGARVNPHVGGYCVHAFTDGDWVVGAGLLDLFRNPKKPYYATAKANRPVILHIRPDRRNVTVGDKVSLSITPVSELEETSATLAVVAADGAGREALHVETGLDLKRGVGEAVIHGLDTSGLSGVIAIEVTLSAGGKTIAENRAALRVLEPMASMSGEVFLLGGGPARVVLEAAGLTCRDFAPGGTPGAPLVVPHPTDDRVGEARAALAYAEAGGTVVYLTLPGKAGAWKVPARLSSPWLSAPVKTRRAKGLWVGVAHIIRRHRVTEGLPSDLMMQDDFQNVYPILTLTRIGEGIEGEVVAGSISYGWNAGQPVEKRNHLGPEGAFWGADLVATPHGKGRIIFTTLRLIPHLGSDAVADRLLCNIVAWASQ